MGVYEDIQTNVSSIVDQTWNERDGQVVPATPDISLIDGAVNLDATILYSDLADSTNLAMYNRKMAAKIFRTFLMSTTKLIRHNGGEIRSFDGDRVMGIFIGTSKNSSAAKCALQIHYVFNNVIKVKLKEAYQVLKDGTFKLSYCTGIDTSKVLVVRSGIRNSNDLVWVGRAPNVAAKLSNIRVDDYPTYISKEVYDRLDQDSKLDSKGNNMWEARTKTDFPISNLYRSNYWWKP